MQSAFGGPLSLIWDFEILYDQLLIGHGSGKTCSSTWTMEKKVKDNLLLLGLFLSLFLVACNHGYLLNIVDGDSGEILKSLPVGESEIFTIKFIHSVVNAPIHEFCYVDGWGRIILKEVKYKKIGVGYGKYIPTRYHSVQREGWYWMSNIEEPVTLSYRVGYIANHTLVVRGHEHPFSDFVPPGELLKIFPVKKPLGYDQGK
jgi:hypothetical protein